MRKWTSMLVLLLVISTTTAQETNTKDASTGIQAKVLPIEDGLPDDFRWVPTVDSSGKTTEYRLIKNSIGETVGKVVDRKPVSSPYARQAPRQITVHLVVQEVTNGRPTTVSRSQVVTLDGIETIIEIGSKKKALRFKLTPHLMSRKDGEDLRRSKASRMPPFSEPGVMRVWPR